MRTVVFVIDGLGVGSPDGAHHTLRSILTAAVGHRYPTLDRLGLLDYADHTTAARLLPSCAAPDTYLGHLEMIAASVQPQLRILDDLRPAIIAALPEYILSVTDHGVILVDDAIAVYDNLDAEPGLSLCVLGSLDEVPYSDVLIVAKKIRAAIDLPRLIAGCGAGWRVRDILDQHTRIEPTPAACRHGLNNGLAGIHSGYYRARHLPHEATGTTLLTRLIDAGQPVILAGKTADLFPATASEVHPAQVTSEVTASVLTALDRHNQGLIFANVQAVDLACHAGDLRRAAAELEAVDHALEAITAALHDDDQLIVTADHGNDPTAGAAHTFEYVPLLGGIQPGTTAPGLVAIADIIASQLLPANLPRQRVSIGARQKKSGIGSVIGGGRGAHP